MQTFSFEEEEQPQKSHCLQQEIGQEDVLSWLGRSHSSMEDQVEEPKILSQLDINAPPQGEIPPQFIKRSSHCSEALDALNGSRQLIEDAQGEDNGEGNQEQGSISLEEGKTFYEETHVSSTLLQGSGLEDCKGENLSEFGLMSEGVYAPLLVNFKSLMDQVRVYTQGTVENVSMYATFVGIKLQQEKRRVELLGERGQENQEMVGLLKGVSTDEKTVLSGILQNDQKRYFVFSDFCEQLQQSYVRLNMLLQKTLQFRQRKIRHIDRYLQKTVKLHEELREMLCNGTRKQLSKWIGMTEIQCDRYLREKYIQQRERTFLAMLKGTGQKIVALLHCIFLKQEQTICSVLNKQIARYLTLCKTTYRQELDFVVEGGQVNMGELSEQLANTLMVMIPKDWQINLKRQKVTCQNLINELNGYIQDQIFLPTATIAQGLVVVRAQARWLAQPLSPHANKKSQKENQSVKSSRTSRDTLLGGEVGGRKRGLQVSVVLTADRYLHLQSGQKIACLRLKRLKLKRKGVRSVLLSQNSGTLTSLFSTPVSLGQLVFEDQKLVEEFIQAVMKGK